MKFSIRMTQWLVLLSLLNSILVGSFIYFLPKIETWYLSIRNYLSRYPDLNKFFGQIVLRESLWGYLGFIAVSLFFGITIALILIGFFSWLREGIIANEIKEASLMKGDKK